MGLFDWMRSVDDRLAQNLSADRQPSRLERWIAEAPGRFAITAAVAFGFVFAAVVEGLRPYPQVNNFLIMWLMVSGLSFGLLALLARDITSRVELLDTLDELREAERERDAS